jgi:Fe2+ transport protein
MGDEHQRTKLESEVHEAMTTNDERPPMHLDTADMSALQLEAARAQGDAYGRAFEIMIGSVAQGGDQQRAGDYLIGYAVEEAQGVYELVGGDLVWREPDDANVHIDISVRNGRDGRFVPGLSIWVTLIDGQGREVGHLVHPMLWHPMLDHYGRNWRVPGDGHYTLLVRVELPNFPRHDRVNGRRFLQPVDVEFRDVEVMTTGTRPNRPPG